MNVTMRRRAGRAVLASLFLSLGGALRADDAAGTDLVGRRVRVQVSEDGSRHTTVGRMVEVGPETMAVADAGGRTVLLPRRDVTRVEISTGRRSRVLKGALIGVLTGLAVTGVYAVACDCQTDDRTYGTAYGLFLLTPLTTASGALVGGMTRTDRWEPAPAGGLKLTLRF